MSGILTVPESDKMVRNNRYTGEATHVGGATPLLRVWRTK